MEQFRVFLEVLKKYHFWVLCGLILLLSFVSWFVAVSAEEKNFGDRKRTIEGKLKTVKDIAGNVEHPSTKYINEILEITSGSLTRQVAEASERLYNEQRDPKNNPLPRLFQDDKAQADFEAAFDKIWQPIEEIEKLPPSQQLEELYRTQYRNHIEGHFPKLFELIERRTVVENADNSGAATDPGGRGGRASMGFGGGDPGALAKSTTGIVDWVDAEQKIKTFVDRFASGTPSTLDIMMAQEDLWVYETLLKVIRNTNNVGPDKDHYKKPPNHKVARIKQILAMDIGRDAVESWSKCESALFTVPGESVTGPGGRPGPTGPAPMSRGPATPTGNSGGSPLAGRYVDDNGKPLADPAQQPYGEFRMMPINLKVVIEQKDIPRLLTECANSAMRIDVRRVRILVQEPPAVDLSEGSGPSTASDTGTTLPGLRPMGRGGMSGGGDTKGEFGYYEESVDPVYQPVPVEVQGIIYIYNPPKVQNAGENGGQAPPNGAQPVPAPGVPPANAAPGTGLPAPAAPPGNANPNRGAVPSAPAGAPTIPPTTPPARGGTR